MPGPDRIPSASNCGIVRQPRGGIVWKAHTLRTGCGVAAEEKLESRCIFDLYSRGVSSFFENHIECFIGDRRLDSTNVETLDALAKLPVERILELSATDGSTLK